MTRPGSRWRPVAAGACAVVLALPAPAGAQEGWFDLDVPGSVEEILGQALPFEGPRLLRGLIELFHGPDSATARESAATLRRCLGDLQRLRSHWRAVERAAGEVSLRAARRGGARRALGRFLDVLGLRLVRDGRESRVAPGRAEAYRRAAVARDASDASGGAGGVAEPEDAAPRTCATGAGGSWQPEEVERRLNAGERIAWDIPHFSVALPLSPRPWLEVLDRRTAWSDEAAEESVTDLAAGVVGRLVTEPGPARLYAGLAALDGPTLAWLARSPRLQSRLYADHLTTFADFGRALRVRDGRVRTPGGPEYAPFWEELVDASVTAPERFADRLFGRPNLAYVYDLVARLPPARQRFVLGSWQPDISVRRDGLRELGDLFRALPDPAPWFADPNGGIQRRPGDPLQTGGSGVNRMRTLAWAASWAAARSSSRAGTPGSFGWHLPHAADPAAALRAIAVDDAGAPAPPASRAFWTRVFAGEEVPDEADARANRVEPLPRIDAAFLLTASLSGPAGAGRARLHAIAFAQRVFGERAAADPAAVFTAARAFARYPMLMLSVERMGVADPRVYAALARAARHIDRVTDPLERPRALSLFQGALALAESARLAGTLSPDAAGPALLALAEARPVRAGSFDGGVAAWLAERLLPELGVPVVPSLDSTEMDDGLLAALAGARPGGTGPRIEWEGLQYRFDRGAATLERLRRARAQLRGNHLDTVLAVARVADELARGAGEASSLTGAADTLEASTAVVRNPHIGLPGVNARISSYANEVESIVRDLREMADRGRPGGLPRTARDLRYVADVLLADLLRTLAYVVHLADAYDADLLGSDVAARHEFGVHIEDAAVRARAAWLPPWGGPAAPYPFHGAVAAPLDTDDFVRTGWRAYGSLLSLDLAFSQMTLLSLRELPDEPLSQGAALTPEDRQFLSLAVPLFDPRLATEAGSARIADAVRHGRRRVQRLAVDAAGLEDLVDAVGIDGARRNELHWILRRRPHAADRFFSRAELYWLGAPRGDDLPAGWGAPGLPLDGCLCTRLPKPNGIDLARAAAERLASTYVDLQLALAEAVDDLGLPAPIVGDLLPFAMGDLLEGAEPASAGDIGDALVRYVHDLPRARIEDYVAMQVGPGLSLRAPELPADAWR